MPLVQLAPKSAPHLQEKWKGFFIMKWMFRCQRIALLLVALMPALATAAIHRVPADFSTIQGAIVASLDGDTIIVSPGTYVENINFGGKNIVLQSSDPLNSSVVMNTIIDGNHAGPVVTFSGTETSECKISGFTIMNGRAVGTGGGGVYGSSTHATVVNNIIKNNWTDQHGGGISAVYGLIQYNEIFSNYAVTSGGGLAICHGVISNNAIHHNESPGPGGGIRAANGLIAGNRIYNNIAQHGGGISYGAAVIENNLIYNNSASGNGGGLNVMTGPIRNNTLYGNSATHGGGYSDCRNVVTNCILWANTASASGAQFYVQPTPSYSCVQGISTGTGNISTNPNFLNPSGGDFRLALNSPCIDAGRRTLDNLPDDAFLAPRGRIYYPTRGDGSGWDIGAVEYMPGSTGILSPIESIEVNAGDQLEIEWWSYLPEAGSALAFELRRGDELVMHLFNGWDPTGRGSHVLEVPHVRSGSYSLRAISIWDSIYSAVSEGTLQITSPNNVLPGQWKLYH